jgi:hypothetical protein
MAVRMESGENTSPTWANVSEMMQEVEREHKCRVIVEMALIPKGKGAMSIDLVAKRVKDRSDWYTCRYVVGRWPTHRVKTMPALLVQLLWRLSEEMHDYDDLPIFRNMMPEAEIPPPPALY